MTRTLCTVIIGAATLLSCARGTTPGTPLPDTVPDAPADVTGARPDIPGSVPGAGAQDSALLIPPLPLPPMIGPEDDRPGEAGLTVRLREAPDTPDDTSATPDTDTPDVAGPAPAGVLSPERAEQLLARLPALPSPDTATFRFPTASPPPPLTGRIVLSPFPPPDTVPAAPVPARVELPLRIVRIVPTGATELAPHLTITFTEAMVPLTTVAGTDARAAPVRLSPQPPGRWSWIDTRTLRFQPDGRFPMATSFAVEVPAGTRSVAGVPLDDAVRVEFSTPAPRALGAYPALHPESDTEPDRPRPGRPRRAPYYPSPDDHARSVGLQPVVLIAFDQRVDPAEVVRAARLLAGGRSHALRTATASEIAADTVVSRLIDDLEEQRWIAVRPVEPLPGDADVRLVLNAGLGSAEGPLTTTQPQEVRFRTYGALRIASHSCEDIVCRPRQPWAIRLTNPVDEDAWSADPVRVEPAMRDMTVDVSGRDVRIRGDTRPNTRYVVTLSPRVRDRFGQALQEPRSVTIDVGAANPALMLPGAPFIVLDPDGPRRVSMQSQGFRALRVSVYRVTPDEWLEYGMAIERWQRSQSELFAPPGALVASTNVDASANAAEFSETIIDIEPALREGLGHAIVVVTSTDDPPVDLVGSRARNLAHAWVQSTRIGLAGTVDAANLFVWASTLDAAQPLAGVQLRVMPTNRSAVTARDGTAQIPLTTPGDAALIAIMGADTALLPAATYGWSSSGPWERRPTAELRWHLLTDRGLYQPGDTVHLKGWLRRTEGSGAAELSLARGVSGIDFTMRGPRREDVGSGALRPGELGGFHTAIALPMAVNLGHAGIELRATGPDVPEPGREAWHSVQVQEFRRPEYEVRVEADPGPHIVGGVIDVMLNANYYGGGGLAGAQLEWRVIPGPGHYTPPGWERWHFGRAPWLPWIGGQRPPETLSGVTNAAGAHRMLIDLLAVDPPFTTALRAEAQVHDVTRQIGSAGVNLLVHPAAVNVGMRMERGWRHPGQDSDLDIIVVDHEGRPVAGLGVAVVIERLRDDWWMRGGAPETDSERTVCRVESDATPVPCRFAVDSAGTYRVRADVRDVDGRISRSELTLWVAGAPGVADPRREPGSFEMIADREEYQTGDTARILVQPPFHPAEAFVTVRSAGVIATQRLRIDSASYELKLPITEALIPNIRVRVELVDAKRGVNFAFGEARISVPPHRRALAVRVQPRDTLARPGGAVTIDVEVRDADGNAAAGAEVALWMVDEAVLALGNYTLSDPLTSFYAPRYGYVMDQNSRRWVVHWPQSAGPGTLSGLVVDGDMGRALAGAIVRLVGTDFETRSAYDGSFTLRDISPGEHVIEITAPNGTTGRRTVTVPAAGAHVGNLVLGAAGLDSARVVGLADAAASRLEGPVAVAPPPPPPAPGMDAKLQVPAFVEAVAGGAQQEVELRTNFAPLAFFEPALRTDAAGRVQVTARLPGSLTRYRIMAVAVAGAQRFGTGDAAVTARRDLMVRIAAPRFLNYGDRFELPVLVQNVTSRAMNVDVAARSSGMSITGPAGRTLTLGPGARAEVRFGGAAGLPGTAHLQVIASANNVADVEAATDAAAQTIPVYTPGTVEAFATYGTIDSDAPVVVPLARPADVIDAFGGLEVSITSTALHSLTDAVLYLHRYPFQGSEHIASRVMSVAALRDVLAAFGAEGLPSPDTLVADVQRDIAELSARQGHDGGWSFWRGGLPSHPFVTIHVAHALQRAHENGFDVPPAALQRVAEYLRGIDTHVAGWPLPVRQSAAAYALYVRHRIGDPAAILDARRLASAVPDRVGGELPIEATGWLLHVLAADPASSALADILHRTLLNRLVETAGTVTFAEKYDDGEHLLLHSRRRTDAVVLDALIAAAGDTDIITRLAQSLLAHRTAGRWSGTQENAWVLLALDSYFRTFEATTPAFDSRVWLDDRFAATHAFEGRTTERQHIDIPMPELLRSDPDELIIAREGAGRMYYRAGVRYAPADPRSPAADRGFVVSRTYEAVDDTADVTRDDDGTWHVRAGARVRVRISMVAPSVRYHAALVDPLPAGFEPLNSGLSGTGFTDDPGADTAARDARAGLYGTWRPTWFEHQNLRDDRAEAFAALLPAGAYDYTYLVRATTPGTFVVPPARAEMMYQPETFGRGTGHVVVVEER